MAVLKMQTSSPMLIVHTSIFMWIWILIMYSAGSKVKDQCEKMYNYHVQLFQLSLEVYLFVPGKPE